MGYDPNDYRISKQTGVATTAYYLEDKNLEAEYDGNGNLKEKFLRGAVVDELIYGYSYDSSGKATAATYHHDQVTSVTDETAPDGTVLASFQYDPFGNVISQTGTPQSEQMYTGRNYDADSGLYYYRARYYDPQAGRFISEDPKGFAAGVNFYVYVDNNPILANDPLGLDHQIGISAGGSFGFIVLGGNVNVTVGISVPDDWTDWRGYQAFGSAQGGAMLGLGLYGGVGASLVTGNTSAPLPVKVSSDVGVFAEGDLGAGEAVSASVQVSVTNPVESQSAGLPKVGAGYGVWAGAGVYGSEGGATPTLGTMVDFVSDAASNALDTIGGWFGSDTTTTPAVNPTTVQTVAPDLTPLTPMAPINLTTGAAPAAGGFVIYPDMINSNQEAAVYSK